MSAPSKKKKKHTRKKEKRYEKVIFTSKIFDGEFVLPTPEVFPLGVINAAHRNDLNPLIEFLREAKVDEEDIEAIESLQGDELEEFMTEWGKGTAAEFPKS